MFLKALLVCDDARFELSGTVTLVGVHREVVGGIQVGEQIRFVRLVVVAMVGGLTGVGAIQHRYSLRAVDGAHVSRESPLVAEDRDVTSDEHVFLFGNAPLIFPTAGAYEVVLEVRAMQDEATYRYGFWVEAIGAVPA